MREAHELERFRVGGKMSRAEKSHGFLWYPGRLEASMCFKLIDTR